MARLKNIHPGEVLQEEFLVPFGISAYKLAKDTGIPQTRISEIVKGNRRITADTALRLSKYFGNSAKFWLGLQDDYDLEEEMLARKATIDAIKTLPRSLMQNIIPVANKKQHYKLDDIGIIGSQEKKGAASSAYHRKKTGKAFRKTRAAATPPSPRLKKAS